MGDDEFKVSLSLFCKQPKCRAANLNWSDSVAFLHSTCSRKCPCGWADENSLFFLFAFSSRVQSLNRDGRDTMSLGGKGVGNQGPSLLETRPQGEHVCVCVCARASLDHVTQLGCAPNDSRAMTLVPETNSEDRVGGAVEMLPKAGGRQWIGWWGTSVRAR